MLIIGSTMGGCKDIYGNSLYFLLPYSVNLKLLKIIKFIHLKLLFNIKN